MKRNIYQKLCQWKSSPQRKPLVLRGARQVGKTYILKNFGENEYEDLIYINFDEEPHFCDFFEENLNPERIIKELGIHFKKQILPEHTLLIFDEIQECPNALNSLKYFCEKKNEFHVATAGSLLGVKLTKGFPVGKVNFLDMDALTFFEFLNAIDESQLVQMLKELESPRAISTPFHDKLIKLLKYYLVIGGMPEAVNTFIQQQDLEKVRIVQKEILDAYSLDFAKHAPKEEVMKIMEVWESIPNQLAKENKKFMYQAIHKSARARNYSLAIQWLKNAGLIFKSNSISVPNLPLDAYADKSAFKLFLLDVGLLGAMSQLDPRMILEGNQLFKEFKGSLTENFVAQELHHKHFDELYYWKSSGLAEVDFVISTKQHVFPLEVKAGVSKKKKSLIVYGNKYPDAVLSRASLKNFAYDGKVINYPLYTISLFPNFTLNHETKSS